jgi:hypothetical protein
MKNIDYKTSNCCNKQSIANLDHLKASPSNWHNSTPIVNRVCLHCYSHWYGEAENIKQYSKKEWDKYINE